MDYEQIRYDVDGPILTLTLNRPDKLNAFTVRMMQELIDAFDRADADDAVRVIIVTGAGRAFCAGADLSAEAALRPHGGIETDHHRHAPRRRRPADAPHLRVEEAGDRPPSTARRSGLASRLTLPMDVRIAATGSRMGFVFTKRGIVPEACSSWFLPRLVGISAPRNGSTPAASSREEALAAGLVSRVTSPETCSRRRGARP